MLIIGLNFNFGRKDTTKKAYTQIFGGKFCFCRKIGLFEWNLE